jgi:hypothetical protein
VREGRGATFLPLPATAPDAPKPAAAGGDQQQQQRHQRLGKAPPGAVLAATPLADLPVSKWLVQNPLAAPPGQAPGAGAEGVTLAEVRRGQHGDGARGGGGAVSKWLEQNLLATPPGQAPAAETEGVTLADVSRRLSSIWGGGDGCVQVWDGGGGVGLPMGKWSMWSSAGCTTRPDQQLVG